MTDALDPTFVLAWCLAGSLVAAAVIGIIVQRINHHDDPRHAKRPPAPP